ncbi:MAG TPA: hypothetical protein VJI15_06605 [Candidatus Nanoarchaeia archaeon]|nr:hypothetical protein [Candidatus Nanoarchaeia archaeon]
MDISTRQIAGAVAGVFALGYIAGAVIHGGDAAAPEGQEPALEKMVQDGSSLDLAADASADPPQKKPLSAPGPLTEYKQFERQQRDVLYSAISRDASFWNILGLLEEKVSHLDKFHPPQRKTVGFMEYFFDRRGVFKGLYTFDGTLQSLQGFKEYCKSVSDKANELKLDEQERHGGECNSDRLVSVVYDSIRNPTEHDLQIAYRLLKKMPNFIVSGLTERIEAAVQEADSLFAKEADGMLPLFLAKIGDGYYTPFPEDKYTVLPIKRSDQGDLLKAETVLWQMVLPLDGERMSPFGRYLFRRGPRFTHNLQIVLTAPRETEQEFVRYASDNIRLSR